jgi:hypothetical protein
MLVGHVERLRYRHEAGAGLVQNVDDAREVGEAAGKPVDIVDNNHVDFAGSDLSEQALEGGPLQRSACEPSVVIVARCQRPALMALAGDVGRTGPRCASRPLNSCSSPSSVDLRV